MFVCKDNIVYIFGSTKEGFIGNYSDDPKVVKSTDVKRMDDVKQYISSESISKNVCFFDAFTNSRKLFNTKINKLLKDNYSKKQEVDLLEKQRDSIKKNLENRIKSYITTLGGNSLKFPGNEIMILINLLKYFEDKIKRVVSIIHLIDFNKK